MMRRKKLKLKVTFSYLQVVEYEGLLVQGQDHVLKLNFPFIKTYVYSKDLCNEQDLNPFMFFI